MGARRGRPPVASRPWVLAMLVASSLSGAHAVGDGLRPDVLFAIVDDLGCDIAGDASLEVVTPHIDSQAALVARLGALLRDAG